MALAVMFCVVSQASAARLDPDATDLTVLPGTSAVRTIGIVNDGEETKQYALSLHEVSFGTTADDLVFSDLEADATGWLTLSRSLVIVPAHSTENVDVTVTVPGDAPSQSRTFAVIAQETGAVPGGNTVTVRSGLATLLFISLGDGLAAHLEVAAFQAIPATATTAPIHFVALLTNNGTGNAQPTGQIVVRNVFGHVVDVLPLTNVPRRVPAQTSRVFSVVWDGTKGFYFGSYKATLEVLSPDGQNIISASTHVVLLPWRSVALVGGIAGVFLLALWWLRRGRFRQRSSD